MTFFEVPYKCVNFHFLYPPKKVRRFCHWLLVASWGALMIKTNWLRREGRKSETETWNGRKDRNISFYVYIYIYF